MPGGDIAVVCVAADVSAAVEVRLVEMGLESSRDAKGGSGESVAAQALTSIRVARVRANCTLVTVVFLRQQVIYWLIDPGHHLLQVLQIRRNVVGLGAHLFDRLHSTGHVLETVAGYQHHDSFIRTHQPIINGP